MNFSEQYIRSHILRGSYNDDRTNKKYSNHIGWDDYVIGSSMIFSHRDTDYTKESFTEGLHAHEYYELLIYIEGDVEYIKDNTLIRPLPYSAIWFAPGQMMIFDEDGAV